MKFCVRRAFGSAFLLAALPLAAHAAPIATLTCPGDTAVKANLSSYTLGVETATNIASPSKGTGFSKVTFLPFSARTSLVNYEAFSHLAEDGTSLTSCIVESKLANGTEVAYRLRTVRVSTVSAVAQAATSTTDTDTSYAEIDLIYSAIDVRTVGVDDGGKVSSSWNRVPNQTDNVAATAQ